MIGRHRTRASGPICGIAAPPAAAAASDASRGVDPGAGEEDEGEQPESAEQRLDEHHGTLADPVGEAARDG